MKNLITSFLHLPSSSEVNKHEELEGKVRVKENVESSSESSSEEESLDNSSEEKIDATPIDR